MKWSSHTLSSENVRFWSRGPEPFTILSVTAGLRDRCPWKPLCEGGGGYGAVDDGAGAAAGVALFMPAAELEVCSGGQRQGTVVSVLLLETLEQQIFLSIEGRIVWTFGPFAGGL
jgi:hypothetical protein